MDLGDNEREKRKTRRKVICSVIVLPVVVVLVPP